MPAKAIEHSKREHALLSASGASRWLNCTPSAMLEEQFGVKTTSVFAKEGTLAHEISELYIRHDVMGSCTDEEFQDAMANFISNELYKDEMLDYVQTYVDYCAAQYNDRKTNGKSAVIEIEQKLDLTDYVPESFGTADCVIISDGTMEVIDLKYGKGVPVYATWNKQLMLYGIGAFMKYSLIYDIVNVHLSIVQPRLNNISTWEISVEELLDWANNDLKKRAEDAFNGRGELASGDWCKFCTVKARCQKLYEDSLEVAKSEFATGQKEIRLLNDEEVSDVLRKAPVIIDYLESVKEYAQKQAIDNDKHWPGFKLVAGRSQRKWIDPEAAMDTIAERHPECQVEELFEMKPKTITQIEKLFGKATFQNEFSDLVVKPDGAPTLVPEDDKRPAINQAYEDFKQ